MARRLPKPNIEHWRSLKEYADAVLDHWMVLLVGGVATIVGLIQVHFSSFSLGVWTCVVVAVSTFLIAQFLAYHDLRIAHHEINSTEAMELALQHAGPINPQLQSFEFVENATAGGDRTRKVTIQPAAGAASHAAGLTTQQPPLPPANPPNMSPTSDTETK
jgi:hypothetical protein